MKVPQVRAFMKTDVLVLRPETPMRDALHTLVRHHLSGAPVVENGKVVGMLSEKDFLHVFTTSVYQNVPDGPVQDYMRREITGCAPDDELFEVAETFFHHTFRRMPVLEEGKLVGIVSRSDVLRAIVELWGAAGEKDHFQEGVMSAEVKAALGK
jgi:CBS domain-containing protein